MDSIVGEGGNISRLIEFLQKLNEISEIKGISAGVSFKFSK